MQMDKYAASLILKLETRWQYGASCPIIFTQWKQRARYPLKTSLARKHGSKNRINQFSPAGYQTPVHPGHSLVLWNLRIRISTHKTAVFMEYMVLLRHSMHYHFLAQSFKTGSILIPTSGATL
jgi:hypothetical protein